MSLRCKRARRQRPGPVQQRGQVPRRVDDPPHGVALARLPLPWWDAWMPQMPLRGPRRVLRRRIRLWRAGRSGQGLRREKKEGSRRDPGWEARGWMILMMEAMLTFEMEIQSVA